MADQRSTSSPAEMAETLRKLLADAEDCAENLSTLAEDSVIYSDEAIIALKAGADALTRREGGHQEAPDRAGQWRDIASAPKDGQKLLLWWRSEFGDGVAYWACAHWQEFGDGSKGWMGESFHASEPDYWTRILGSRPTHWQPLPPPPERAQE